MMDTLDISYHLRQVRPEDIDEVSLVEAACFNEAEAALRDTFTKRIQAFPDSFFVAEEDKSGRIIGFINGCVTENQTITDDMFEDESLHNPLGSYQSIFGLDVLPAFRNRGIAAALMKHMIKEAKRAGRRGLILTCKEPLIPYYERFGYINMGLSASVHGDAVWFDMRLLF